MDTITIPTTDYTQRADDEGRDYHAYRTIAAAAEKWADRVDRAWDTTNTDNEDTYLVFSYLDGGRMMLASVGPDEEMDGLYPADELPFKIVTPVTFKTGDYIARKNRTDKAKRAVWRVVEVFPNGALGVVYVRTGLETIKPGDTGSIPASNVDLYELCDAPTVTYTVTVRGDHTADDLRDMLGNLGGAVTVEAAE